MNRIVRGENLFTAEIAEHVAKTIVTTENTEPTE
jgi:ribosomal protein L7Ae-like RNA K-turn-binding protein